MAKNERMTRHTVPAPILKQIGDVTVSFEMLQGAIRQLITLFIAEDHRIAQIVTAEMSSKNCRSLLRSLYQERCGEDAGFKELCRLNKSARDLEERRNQIIHSRFAGGSPSCDTITRIKTTAKERQGLRHQVETIDVAAIKSIADDMKRLHSEYMQFKFDLLKPISQSTPGQEAQEAQEAQDDGTTRH